MSALRRAVRAGRYRLGQFLRACFGAVAPDELERALAVLPLQAQALFLRQARQDQRHALAVHGALVAAGHSSPELLQAALLHDVGKAAGGVPLLTRGFIVVLGRLAPRYSAKLSHGRAEGWRRPFVVHAQHADEGARQARDAGCSPLTVSLIRRHQQPLTEDRTEEDRLLTALQTADGRS